MEKCHEITQIMAVAVTSASVIHNLWITKDLFWYIIYSIKCVKNQALLPILLQAFGFYMLDSKLLSLAVFTNKFQQLFTSTLNDFSTRSLFFSSVVVLLGYQIYLLTTSKICIKNTVFYSIWINKWKSTQGITKQYIVVIVPKVRFFV